MRRLVGLHEAHHHLRHLVGGEDAVVAEARIHQPAALVEQHLLAHGIAQRLGHAALDLAHGRGRVDDHAAVQHHHQLVHRHLTGAGVHGHVRELRGERRRAVGADVGADGHDLVLAGLVQAVQRDLGQGDAAAIVGPRLALGQHDLLGRHVQDLTRHRLDLLGDLARRHDHGRARDVGRAAGVRAHVERREVGVGRVGDEVLRRAAQHLGGHLRQHGVRAGAQVGRAHQQVEAAVVVHLDARRAHVQVGDGGALHDEGDAFAVTRRR